MTCCVVLLSDDCVVDAFTYVQVRNSNICHLQVWDMSEVPAGRSFVYAPTLSCIFLIHQSQIYGKLLRGIY